MRSLAFILAFAFASRAAALTPAQQTPPPMSPLLEAAMLQHVDVLTHVRLADAVNAGAVRVGGGGLSQTLADTLYCKLTGCTMAGDLVMSGASLVGVNNAQLDIKSVGSSGSIALHLTGNVLKLFNGNDAGQINIQTVTGAQGAMIDGAAGALLAGNAFGAGGRDTTATATTATWCEGKSMAITAGGTVTKLGCVYGSDFRTAETVQTATCAAGVVAVDPQSSVITIDSNAGTCTATIGTTTAVAIAKEGRSIRITAKNVGASTLKIASTNFATIPTRCSSTGLSAGQSADIAWSQDQAKWTFLGGCE